MPQTLATIVPPLQANCKTENIRHTLKHTHARTHARAKSAILHLYLRAQRTHDDDGGTRAYEPDMRFGCERVQSRCPASREWTTLAPTPTMTLQRSKRMNQRVVSEYLRTTVVLLNPHAFHACVRTYATKSGAVERRRNLCDFTCAPNQSSADAAVGSDTSATSTTAQGEGKPRRCRCRRTRLCHVAANNW